MVRPEKAPETVNRFGRVWNVQSACPPLMNQLSLMCALHFRTPSGPGPSISRRLVPRWCILKKWKDFFSKLLIMSHKCNAGHSLVLKIAHVSELKLCRWNVTVSQGTTNCSNIVVQLSVYVKLINAVRKKKGKSVLSYLNVRNMKFTHN